MRRAKIKQGERPKASGTSHDVKANVGADKHTQPRRLGKLSRKARAR